MAANGIQASTLILCERLEIAQFMQVYIKHLQLSGIAIPSLQMFNFNSIERLDGMIERLENSVDFHMVHKVYILADVVSKLNAKEMAVMRASNRLNKFPNMEAAYYLFPGLRTTKRWEFGFLEDALLKALKIESSETAEYFNLRNMAEEYIFSVNVNRGKDAKFINTSLHVLNAYLAGTEQYAGMRVAEAATNGAFDLEHAVFAPFKERFVKFLEG